MRLRLIKEAYSYLLERDPNSAISKYAFKRFVLCGFISSLTYGSRRFIDLDSVDEFLNSPISLMEKDERMLLLNK